MPRLASVATAVPQHRLAQDEVRTAVEALLGGHPDLHRILAVFETAGVAHRYLARPPDWYVKPHGWQDRTESFIEVALEIAQKAAQGALDRAHLTPHDIDGVVFVTSTGVSTPSLEARLSNRMGLRPNIVRLPLWGLGCSGGVAGLARAADLATARPNGRFLLISLELCSLAFLRNRLDKKLLVATALFGDGAAAAILEGDDVAGPGNPWHGSASHQWPSTERIMGWDVRDDGLDVVFDTQIPAFVAQNVKAPVTAFLGEKKPGAWALHPGGAKILEAYQTSLGLDVAALAASRGILREYGNMSSPTALFVLERLLGDHPAATALVGAVGPGFSSELALVGPRTK